MNCADVRIRLNASEYTLEQRQQFLTRNVYQKRIASQVETRGRYASSLALLPGHFEIVKLLLLVSFTG